MKDEDKAVPVWLKSNLTLEEAAAYTGVGICNSGNYPTTAHASLCFGLGRNDC